MINIGIDPTKVSSTPEFTLGTISVVEANGGTEEKAYKYVQYNAGTGAVAAVAGQVAYYYLAGGYKNSIVTSDLSDSVNLGAGVLQSAPATGQYCWVQIAGPATLSIALTAGC